MGIESLARPEIVAMKPYSSARKEAPGKGVLLNANESPWPLLKEPGSLNRYPDPQPLDLILRLSSLYRVPKEQLLLTRGSDEGIDLLTRVFCRAGQDAIALCPPNFGMYRIAAQTQGADIVSVPRKIDDCFVLDEQALLSSLQADDRIKLVFLTSPNNPTGDIIGKDYLRQLLWVTANRAIVVLDEAYTEFCDQASASGMIADFENLVVLRTMSKAWAAAGLRCGSVLAQPSVISLLQRVVAPYPLPSPVVSLALRMLEDDVLEKQKHLLQELKINKQLLLDKLAQLSFIRELFPGEANFVLIRVSQPDELLAFCANRNIFLRGFPADPLLQGCLRISVGSEDDIMKLAAALEEWENTR
jgi:histidinol-phosphate aminotransferase